jgi:hypothetical protein
MELLALVAIIAGTAILAGLIAFGLGRRRHGEAEESTRLEEYPFYPFVVNEAARSNSARPSSRRRFPTS